MKKMLLACCFPVFVVSALCGQVYLDSVPGPILTPPPSDKPRINGPKIFAVRPGNPFFYHVPVSGLRPLTIEAKGLPKGLRIDAKTGNISGTIPNAGKYPVTLTAKNKQGTHQKPFTIVAGEELSLTPAMGWNSWNCWGSKVDQGKTMQAALAFTRYKLDQHGWTYINIDDAWQGQRGGPANALRPDPKRFPDMKGLCDSVHALGLKIGIYSTPWVRSYANRLGGSSENEKGEKDSLFTKKVKYNANMLPAAIGKYRFDQADAQQWADWGFDYLKYDWGPVTGGPAREMHEALRKTGRDIVLSLSNNDAGNMLDIIDSIAPHAESWRTGKDIVDSWKSVCNLGFGQDKWAMAQRPGHFNDPDMLVVGHVGWGKPHPSKLTPDEQYAHISLWCLMSSPLLLGCDLEKLDRFTLGLITNDEVLEIDQDMLCKQALRVGGTDSLDVYAKPLDDGNLAVGLFNRSLRPAKATAYWKELGITGKRTVRDLWRQKNLAVTDEKFEAEVAPHGVVLVKLSK